GIIFWIYKNYGWPMAFIIMGLLGFIWLIFWLIYYEAPARQKSINQAEFDHIHSDAPEVIATGANKLTWFKMLGLIQTWAFVFGKFFTDPVWWFYLFWIPSYFNSRYNIDLKSSWVYVTVIYGITTIGSVLGGYLPGWLINRGWGIYHARKMFMLFYALCVTPIFF